MKVHEKAKAYDELMKDIEKFIAELTQHADSIDSISNSEEGKDSPTYYARKCGILGGSNFGLQMKISTFKGVLNRYKRLK